MKQIGKSAVLVSHRALLAVVLFILSGSFVVALPRHGIELKPTLILISIDGLRADYLAKYNPPHLTSLAREGVRARWMTPSYPSLTFPNHYTIATGLYPQHHGIVGNDIYDPTTGASFSMSKTDAVRDARWWGGEPVWVTAEKQGQRTGAYFFPGTETEIGGVRPTYWKPYDGKVPNFERVDTALSWLDLPPERRPTFITFYFSDVDHAGHEASPDSEDVAQALATVDTAVGRFIDGLKARGIYEQVNIIIVSDHGMATVNPLHVTLLDDHFDVKRAERIVWGGQLTQIFPKAGEERTIYRALKGKRPKHVRCYLKREVPSRFHYRDSARIGAIICMADEGWRIMSRRRFEDDRQKGEIPKHAIGAHGYDNRLASMRATFIAHGAAFKRGVVVAPFPNVDVYNIMARVLGLKPAPNDGSQRAARLVLAKEVRSLNSSKRSP
jgi:predicted AlkP superfamily pyrophosphatase or phosphodiesterase